MEHGELGTAAIIAVLVSEAIEMSKRFGWSPTSGQSASVNRVVAGLAAFISGIGINMIFEPTTGTLIISGLLVSGLSHGVAQFAAQQAYYRLAIKGAGKQT